MIIPSQSSLHHLAHWALQSIFRALQEAYGKILLLSAAHLKYTSLKDAFYPLAHQ